MSNKRAVWILGAGFSVPLGGPLFRELISERMQSTLEEWEHFSSQSRRLSPTVPASACSLCKLVRLFYDQGVADRLWQDAEQFLERLEIARQDRESAPAREVWRCFRRLAKSGLPTELGDLMAVPQVHPELMHTEAIRFVAGACTAFLIRAHDNPKVVDESEQWDPYRRWYSKLEPALDSVISFNYDAVPDLLAAHGLRQKPPRDLFITPAENLDLFHVSLPNCVPFYPLHGLAAWKRRGDGTIDVDTAKKTQHGSVAYIYPEDALIGVPGQTKLSLPGGLLKCVWDPAMEAIEQADAVILVGYRFPETDNYAKRRLTDSLKRNPRACVHLVLGANNPDTPRVQSMLEWTRPKDRVRVHPLWAQDFLTVYERNGLW